MYPASPYKYLVKIIVKENNDGDRYELKILIGLHRVNHQMDQRTRAIARKYHLSLGQFAVLEAYITKGI